VLLGHVATVALGATQDLSFLEWYTTICQEVIAEKFGKSRRGELSSS
ncbi:hypothetical protein NPIL_652901, partial [Nephila pilipes]